MRAYRAGTVYPEKERLFAAFAWTPPERVRAVILGQDPYHGSAELRDQDRSGRGFSPNPEPVSSTEQSERRNPSFPSCHSEERSDEGSESGEKKLLRCPFDFAQGKAQEDGKRGSIRVPQANGLAFSVNPGVPLPPSLKNMFRELESDLGLHRTDGDLSDWAKQGVLLLNTVLTVEEGRANSHRDLGWQAFTDDVIFSLRELPQPIAFVLWGSQAQKKRALTESPHPRLILESPHPSPLSAYRGFFGSKPFSQINNFLTEHGEEPIRWG